MAKIWYGHFDSTPDDERLMLAEDWAKYIRSFITDGIKNGGTCLQVTSDGGMNVKLAIGTANIQGYIFDISEDHNGMYLSVPVPDANPSYPRIDRLVLRLDRTIQNRAIIPMIIIGTASANPVPAPLTRNENIYELSLAQIHLNAGVLQIFDSNITDERFNQDVCGIMHSILGLDSASWQAAFDAFMIEIRNTFTASQQGQENKFNEHGEARENLWRQWFDGVQNEIALAANFNFWNAACLPGNRYVTEYPNNSSIVTTITKVSDGSTVAVGTTTYPDNGSVVYEEKVYQNGGILLQRHTKETTTYPSDGTIRREVENLL